MNWLVIITISLVSYSIATIFQKLILNQERIHPISFCVIFEVVCGIIFLIAALVFNTLDLNGLFSLLPFLALATVLYVGGNYFVFLALQKLDASKYTVIFASRGLFTVLASAIFLGDKLDSTTKILGVALIILGVIIVTVEKFDKNLFKLTKYEVFALLAALCIGFVNTVDSHILRNMDLYTYTAFAFLVPGILIGLISKEGRDNIKPLINFKDLSKILVFCVLLVVSAFTFFTALGMHNSAEVASVNLLGTVLTVMLGIGVLGERKNILKKLVGALVSVAGLLLITLG